MNKLDKRLVVAYGGGVNSTAMLVEMYRRSIRPDLILFADTKAERPETYATVKTVSEWCDNAFSVPIVTVTRKGNFEADMLRLKCLPSIAYGFKTCSQKEKLAPQERYLKTWLQKGEAHTKAIGFDAGEERRVRESDDATCKNWFPLIEWGIWREECEAICQQAGLPIAKSSCFFCPSMRRHEVLELSKKHPHLMQRALDMESNATLTTVKGLGRNWAWADFLNNEKAQGQLFPETVEIACGCYDG